MNRNSSDRPVPRTTPETEEPSKEERPSARRSASQAAGPDGGSRKQIPGQENAPEAEYGPDEASAGKELKQAAAHLRSAAALLWERATQDPTALRATERIVNEVADRAEPLAKQISSGVLKASQQLLEWAVPNPEEPEPSEGSERGGSSEGEDDRES